MVRGTNLKAGGHDQFNKILQLPGDSENHIKSQVGVSGNPAMIWMLYLQMQQKAQHTSFSVLWLTVFPWKRAPKCIGTFTSDGENESNF